MWTKWQYLVVWRVCLSLGSGAAPEQSTSLSVVIEIQPCLHLVSIHSIPNLHFSCFQSMIINTTVNSKNNRFSLQGKAKEVRRAGQTAAQQNPPVLEAVLLFLLPARACPVSGFPLWHQRPSPPCSRNQWVASPVMSANIVVAYSWFHDFQFL